MSEHAIILDADFTRELTDKEVEFLVKEFTELLRDKRKHKVKIINDIWTRVTPKESGG